MAQLAKKLRLTDYFSLGWGTMVGVGWLVVMDDWLLRGGSLVPLHLRMIEQEALAIAGCPPRVVGKRIAVENREEVVQRCGREAANFDGSARHVQAPVDECGAEGWRAARRIV